MSTSPPEVIANDVYIRELLSERGNSEQPGHATRNYFAETVYVSIGPGVILGVSNNWAETG
jgi:hypothetical protein